MTYPAVDTSIESGRPVELYRWVNGSSVWTFNSGQSTIAYNGENYLSEVIERGAIEANQEIGKANLELTMPYTNAVSQLLAGGYPTGILSVTIFRAHFGDMNWITAWKGRVVSADFKNHLASIKCEPAYTSLTRAGLHGVYQLGCRHLLYGPLCGAVKANNTVNTTINTYVANQFVLNIAANNYPDGWFTGGALQTAHGDRLIIAHSGNSVTTTSPIPGVNASDAVSVVAGCDHTFATCGSKFANQIDYGGFPWIPLKNPFSGDGIV